ncbi:type III pantothenate kinase [Sulfurimonas sp.]|nr:type III pantothenate kinase [Sulfurimonas sp.]
MFLCDIGNTSYHFLNKRNDYKESVKTFDPQTIQETIYYICVNVEVKKKLDTLENWIDLSQYIDKKNYYETMGIDRIFACEAISDGVVVDAGSAITVDLVEAGVFKGGFIYPGIEAMSETYKNISLALDYPFNYDVDISSLPKNSRDAISYGYLKTLYTEVISHDKQIFLTGGNAKELLRIFPDAKVNAHLIFDGMKKIIEKVV